MLARTNVALKGHKTIWESTKLHSKPFPYFFSFGAPVFFFKFFLICGKQSESTAHMLMAGNIKQRRDLQQNGFKEMVISLFFIMGEFCWMVLLLNSDIVKNCMAERNIVVQRFVSKETKTREENVCFYQVRFPFTICELFIFVGWFRFVRRWRRGKTRKIFSGEHWRNYSKV